MLTEDAGRQKMKRALYLSAAALLTFCAPAISAAQDMIDVFRGEEIDDRDFVYDQGHFLNVLSYEIDPEWEKTFEFSRNGHLLTAGTLDDQEIWIHQQLKLQPQLTEKLSYRFHFQQAEDFESRYVRFLLEAEYAIHPNWKISIPFTPLPQKDSLDLGIGLTYTDENVRYLKLTYIGTNLFFNNHTAQNRRFEKNPGTVAFQGNIQAGDFWTKWTAGEILPLEWELRDQFNTFEYQRFYYRNLSQISLCPDSDLWFWISGEKALKNRLFEPGLELFNTRLNRRVFTGRAELRRRWGPHQGKLGFQYLGLREDNEMSFPPPEETLLRRREHSAYVGYEYSFGDAEFAIFDEEQYVFFTTFYFSQLNNREGIDGSIEDDDAIVKLSAGFHIQFTPDIRMTIAPTFRSAETASFVGTNVQLSVNF